MIAMTPKIASANSPSSSISTKKTPMIALKSVKTLPATMLDTEREEISGGGPRSWSRFSASLVERPRGLSGSTLIRLFNRVRGHGVEAWTEPRLLGDRARRRGGRRGRAGCRADRLRVGLGRRVLRLRRRQRPRLAGAADLDDQPRRRDSPGPGAAAGDGGDGRGDDRQTLRRAFHVRLRP